MRRITLLLLLTWTISSFAQDLSLIGEMPINCTVFECSQILNQKGCSLVKSDKKSSVSYFVVENGDLANCVIKLYGTKDGKFSYMEFYYPECDSWNALYDIYAELSSRMILEYGEPNKVSEEFLGDQQPESDYEKLNEVINGQCSYSSLFNTKNGVLNLFISKMKSVVIQLYKY